MCECMDFLTKPQPVEGKRGMYRFLDIGIMLNMQTGETETKPVLRGLKDGKDGRISLAPAFWMPIKYCPNCGDPVEEWANEPVHNVDADGAYNVNTE